MAEVWTQVVVVDVGGRCVAEEAELDRIRWSPSGTEFAIVLGNGTRLLT